MLDSRAPLARAFAGLLVGGVIGVGCQSGIVANLGDDCLVNSDCSDPYVCALGQCHQSCTKQRDCPTGARCAVAGPLAVCLLLDETYCGVGSCPISFVCASDAQCRSRCVTDDDCLGSQACVQLDANGIAACFERSAIDAGTKEASDGD